eukprot:6766648-Pyramimonas_sp.AAC.1
MKEQSKEFNLRLCTDSSAALGHCSRLGNGKEMRHLETAELWIQQILRTRRATIEKINGKASPADLFTRYLSEAEIVRHTRMLGSTMKDNYGQEIGIKGTNLDMSWEPESEENDADDLL